jgi:hypothetical protein
MEAGLGRLLHKASPVDVAIGARNPKEGCSILNGIGRVCSRDTLEGREAHERMNLQRKLQGTATGGKPRGEPETVNVKAERDEPNGSRTWSHTIL